MLNVKLLNTNNVLRVHKYIEDLIANLCELKASLGDCAVIKS